MCELFDPDANGKNGLCLRINTKSVVPDIKCTGSPRKIACASQCVKGTQLARTLANSGASTNMDLAATIFENNLDNNSTVEEGISKQTKKIYGSKHQPKGEIKNDSDYKNLKEFRKNYKQSVKHVKENERGELLSVARQKQDEMNAAHAARREEKRMNEKTEEQKKEARKFYAERREVIKRDEIIKNKGTLGPLDLENQLTREMRLRYYNRHHKCICGKKFNLIFKGEEGYIVRCSHKTQRPSKVSTSKTCISCGSSNLEIHASRCGCKNYYCQKCRNSNYFYKDVEDPESKVLCTSWQSYDCHPGNDVNDDLHFTIKIPDHHIETTDGVCPVVGGYRDIVIKQSIIQKDVARKNISKINVTSKKKFLTTLKGDMNQFSWADRVRGQKSVTTSNAFEALDIEEPKIEESVEQGGMISTALSSSKAATTSAFQSVKQSLTELLTTLDDMKEKVLRSIASKFTGAFVEGIIDRFRIVRFFLNVLYANLDFEVCGNFMFILTRCFVDGVFNLKSFFANVFQLGMIAIHIGEKTAKQLDILHARAIPVHAAWTTSKAKKDVTQAAVFLCNDYEECSKNKEIDRYERYMREFPNLRPILHEMFSDPSRLRKYLVLEKDGLSENSVNVTFNRAGVHFVASKTLASMLKLIGDTSEDGNFGFEGLCDCLKSTFNGLFSADTFKGFFGLLRTISPIFTVYKGMKEVITDIAKSISKFVLGDLPPHQWLEREMYEEGSPVHELYSIYMSYVATTVPGSTHFLEGVSPSELRTLFYLTKEKCDRYVRESKKFSTKYASWLKYMESGLATPPQPKERPNEPTVLVLHGPPGVGKSTIWPHIIGYALGLSPKEVRESTHTWNGASEYQPGMADKKIILFDDFGQDRTKNDETLNLIRLCTSAPFMVNSANIVGTEIKGMYAEPQFIVLCTNDQDLATDQVFSGAAVIRRMDLYIDMGEKLDFTKKDVAQIPYFSVRQCGRYSEVNGKKLSLAHLSGLMKVIHHAKIDSYKKVNRDLEITMGKIDLEDLLKSEKTNGVNMPDFILSSGNLQKEWKQYMAKRQDDEEEENQPRSSKTVDYSQYFKKADLEELVVKEQSMTSDYLVSMASLFLREATTTAIGFTMPVYLIGAYVVLYRDLVNIFNAPTVSRVSKYIFKTIMISMGAVATSFIAYKTLQYITRDETTEESGATRTAKSRGPTLAVSNPQDGVSDSIVHLMKKASGTLISHQGRQINCLAIGGQWLLTAMHFFTDFSTKDTLVREGTEMACIMASGAQIVSFKFEKKRIMQFENNTEMFDGAPVRPDIVLYKMDEKIFPSFKNIIKHFWDGSYNIKNMPVLKVDFIADVTIGGDCADLLGNLKVDFANKEFEICPGIVEEDQVMTVRTKGFDRYYHCVATATYKGRDKSCGSPVMRSDTMVAPVLGIHVAAVMRNGHSMFHYVTSGELTRATSGHVMTTIQESPYVNYTSELRYQSDLPDTHQFYIIGKTDKKHRIFQPTKTDLTPSLLYDSIFPHSTEPSLLSKDDPRIPPERKNDFWPTMFEGYAKYTNLKFEEIEEAVESIIVDNRKLQHKLRICPRVLTDEEVINGSADFPSLGRIPQDTSCGWPYTCEGIKKNKLFEDDGTTLYMKQRLMDDWKDAERCLDDGVVPFLPFVGTVKDERVKLSKIYDTPKSRIFMAGNVVNYMLNRKYYGWFSDMHARAQWSYAIMVLDRVSVEWHYFISSMIEVGDRGFDGDFKWWDKFINSVLKYGAFLIDIDGLVTSGAIQKESPKYCALREMKTRTLVVFGENVYLANGTEPSGELLTFMDNCTMNEIVHRTAYLQIMKKLSPMDANIRSYRIKTRGARAGDDTIQMVAASILKYFNGKTFAAWCKSKNISITGADKSDHVHESIHFKELQFVKNTTGVMYGHYVPLTEIKTLVEQTYWVRLNKDNKDIVKATEDNTNAALRGLYYWGKEIFNEFRDAFLKKEPRLNLLTFAELDLQWQKYGYFPGSHADYATKTDQDPMRTFNPDKLEPIFKDDIRFGLTPISTKNMKVIESEEQAGVFTGIDKASINVEQMHPMAGLEEIMPPKVIGDVPPATTSNVVGSESQVNGAFIQSKEEPVRQQLRTGKVVVAPADFRAQGHLNDKNWTLAKLASKYTSLGQVTWPISATPGTVLKRWNLPNDILTTPALRTPFDVTAYERFQNITFKITSSASPFYAGRLICGFLPTMEKTTTDPANLHLTLTQLGGVVLNPTDNQTVEYSIPYRHYLNWLEYPKDFVGQFYLVVMNGLKTGPSNVNNVTVSVFVSVENAQFKVPEYIGDVTKSQRYIKMESMAQSGDVDGGDDTAIVVTKKINTVNEDFQSNATMMCAGTGLYVEPRVKQFPDHPIDLVQLLKRDNVFSYESIEVPASSGVNPGFITILYPYMDMMQAATREVGEMFAMFRGSLMIKGSFFGFRETEVASSVWEGKAYFINQDLPSTYPGSIEDFNTFARLNLGYHKFDQDHPACFTVPHWSPNFASFNRGEPIVNETPMSWIVLEFYNWCPKPITIKGVVETRIDDDFSMGVFLGMQKISFNPVPPPSRKSKARIIRRGPTKHEDISDFIVLNSRQQGGNIIDSAQEWVTGKAEDLVSGLVKTGVDSVFDLARENLEPVMDIIDLVGNLLDAPPVTLQAAPYMPRKWNYGNANNIMQYTEKLGATNHNGGSYSDKTTYGTNQTETNLYHLITEIKTLWKTISWSTSANSGTLLNWFGVGCNGTEDVLNNNSKVACPMDAMCRFFNYWSGSIIYAMDVVSSQMHTGRLVISFHPNITTLPQGFTLDQATQQYFLSFDLDKGKGCAVLEIPYLCKRPFKPIPLLDSVGTAAYPFSDGFNGIVCIWVMNPLRASETVATTVDINLYKMAGKDFRFEGYGNVINATMSLA